MKNNFQLLDCTLRDGGYYNNWDFNKKNIQRYLNLISKTRINFVELGFRFLDDIKLKGETAYTTEKLLNDLNIPVNLNIGVMVNASDLIKNKRTPLENCKNIFPNIKKSKIKFVRFACHYEEIFKMGDCIKWLKNNSVIVHVNIMQISEINFLEIKKVCKFLKNKTNIIYLADSLGSLKPYQTKKIVSYFKKNWSSDLGIHAHNNLSYALKNTILANRLGVKWLDSTITGMGRGPGNTRTEDIILTKFGKTENLYFKRNQTYKFFKKLQTLFSWGPNKYYSIAAKKKIHPTYIQKILSDKRYKKSDYFKIIESLSKVGAKKYNPYRLINSAYFLNKKPIGNWSPTKQIINKDVLIIGAGQSVIKQKKKIEKIIATRKLFVICLNSVQHISEKLVSLRTVCHPIRMISDLVFYKKNKSNLALPYSMLNKKIKNSFKMSKARIFDYGLAINTNDKIKINNKFCCLPYPLALGYSLCIAFSGKAKSITVAGFDGYKKSDVDRDETEELFSKILKKQKNYKIMSLTKSKFKFLKKLK